jgi:hypothetical protein
MNFKKLTLAIFLSILPTSYSFSASTAANRCYTHYSWDLEFCEEFYSSVGKEADFAQCIASAVNRLHRCLGSSGSRIISDEQYENR